MVGLLREGLIEFSLGLSLQGESLCGALLRGSILRECLGFFFHCFGKMSDKKQPKKGLILAHSFWRERVRKTWWQEREVAGKAVFSVSKQNRKCSQTMEPKWMLLVTTHSEAPSPKSSTTPWNSTVSWGSSVQTPESMEDISHSNDPESLFHVKVCLWTISLGRTLQRVPSDQSLAGLSFFSPFCLSVLFWVISSGLLTSSWVLSTASFYLLLHPFEFLISTSGFPLNLLRSFEQSVYLISF